MRTHPVVAASHQRTPRPSLRAAALVSALALVSATLLAPALGAQAASAGVAALARWRLAPGTHIRASAAGVRVQGDVYRADGAALVVRRFGREQRLLVHEVDSLWVRGDMARQGSVAGAVVGGALLGGLALLYASACTPAPSEDPCETGPGPMFIVGATFLGALGGGAAGTVVGLLVPRWRLRHP